MAAPQLITTSVLHGIFLAYFFASLLNDNTTEKGLMVAPQFITTSVLHDIFLVCFFLSLLHDDTVGIGSYGCPPVYNYYCTT